MFEYVGKFFVSISTIGISRFHEDTIETKKKTLKLV